MIERTRTGGGYGGRTPTGGADAAGRVRSTVGPSPSELSSEREAREAKDEAKAQAREVKEQAKAQAREVKEEVAGRAREMKEEMKGKALDEAERRKRSLAETVGALAGALEAAAARLTEQDEGRLADWTRDASARVERIAGRLRDQDVEGLTDDLRSQARENPAAFVGTSLAAGLAVGRFLRASEPEHGETARASRGMTGGASERGAAAEDGFGTSRFGREGGMR